MARAKEETDAIEATLASTWQEIRLVREYRTRLIADVVVGKLDVREAATPLPEGEAAEPEPVDAVAIEDDDDPSGPAASDGESGEMDET